MMLVREFSPDDSLQALTDMLHRAYSALGKMGLNYTAVDQSVEITADRIRYGHCFVTIEGMTLVGTITVNPTHQQSDCAHFRASGVASANQLAVEPALQSRGIGSALLHHAESWAFAQGFKELALDTAEPAVYLVEFYRRRGYRLVERVQWPGKTYRSVVLSKVV